MRYAFKNGIILNGDEDMVPESGKVILTAHGRITAIIDEEKFYSGKYKSAKKYKVVDLHGMYILPGLINMHVHLPGTGRPPKKRMNLTGLKRLIGCCALSNRIGQEIVAKNARTALMSGTTTVRTMGTLYDYDTKVRDRIRHRKCPGPRILAANTAISVPGGHMAGSFAYEANSANEARELVERLAEEKVDLIKLMITGGVMDAEVVGEPGVLRMPAEYVRAACERAHELRLPVAAHCESPEGVMVALQNGVDTIEHGARPSVEMIKLFKETGSADICTISPAIPYVKLPFEVTHFTQDDFENSKVVFDGVIDCAKACLENGIPVGLGTDSACSFSTQYGMWRELYYFAKYCGVTNSFAIHTATQVNAEIAKIDHLTGTIRKGLAADMIFVKKNPLNDLRALRTVSSVVIGGKYIRKPKFKVLKDVEKELDGIM